MPEPVGSAGTPNSGGNGNGNGNGNGGGRNARNRRTNNGPRRPKFTGMEPALQGSIFSYTGERNPSLWLKTLREIQTFVGTKYSKYTKELAQAVELLDLQDPQQPVLPQQNDLAAIEWWKLEIKEFRDRTQEFTNFRVGLYNLVIGQCTPAMMDRLRSHADFEAAAQDGLALLRIIRKLLHSFDERRQHCDAVNEAKHEFFGIQQGCHESLQDYYVRFMAMYDVLVDLDVTIEDKCTVKLCAEANGRTVRTDVDVKEALDQAVAMNFIRGASNRNPAYLNHLRNAFLDGQDLYPAEVTKARTVILERKDPIPPPPPEGSGTAFAQGGTGGDRNVRCYRCQEVGHIARDCPQAEQSGDVACTNSGNSSSTSANPGHE